MGCRHHWTGLTKHKEIGADVDTGRDYCYLCGIERMRPKHLAQGAEQEPGEPGEEENMNVIIDGVEYDRKPEDVKQLFLNLYEPIDTITKLIISDDPVLISAMARMIVAIESIRTYAIEILSEKSTMLASVRELCDLAERGSKYSNCNFPFDALKLICQKCLKFKICGAVAKVRAECGGENG